MTTPQVTFIERDQFLDRYWSYKPGEHVMLFCPTQGGKTTLLFELVQRTSSPSLPAYVLVTKPKDPTVTKWGAVLKFPRIKDWPPPLFLRMLAQPAGYIVWPTFKMDPDRDDLHVGEIMRKTILGAYAWGKRAKGRSIVVSDEVYSLAEEYKLTRALVTLLTKGGGMGVGEWGATQKPSHIPLWFYSQPTHLFIGNDTDKRARQRYSEIGGNFDPALIDQIVRTLPRYHFLYINTREQTMCIIGP